MDSTFDVDPWSPPEGGAEVPDDVDFGRWLSMDVSPDGQKLVMAAYDKTRDGLLFGVGTPQSDGTVTWLYEMVDGYLEGGFDPGDRGTFASLKVAPDGSVWIASYDATAKNLRYAHRVHGGPATESSTSWKLGVIDAGPNVGTWASLDLDADGKPVVAYHDEGNGTLKVAHLQSEDGDVATWDVTVAAQGDPFLGGDTDGAAPREADVGEFARLMIEGGTEFVAYYDKAQQRLGLAEGQGGSYNLSLVSPEGINAGQWPSMLWDNGALFVAYHDVGNQRLMVAARTDGAWSSEAADDKPFVGADSEIVKRGGKLGVVYFDGQENDVKYVTKSGNAWVADRLDGEGVPVGFHNEIVRLGERWWVGTYDFSTKRPKFILLPDTSAAN
jgi:hypothetical protein